VSVKISWFVERMSEPGYVQDLIDKTKIDITIIGTRKYPTIFTQFTLQREDYENLLF